MEGSLNRRLASNGYIHNATSQFTDLINISICRILELHGKWPDKDHNSSRMH